MLRHAQRVPLSSAQKSIWYYEKLHPGTPAYHHTIVFDLEKPNINLFRQAIRALAMRHEALQYKLDEFEGQIYLASLPAESHSHWDRPLHIFDLSQMAPAPVEDMINTLKMINEDAFITRPFNLEQEALWRCALLHFDENRFQFVMVAHHLIVDVASKNILMRDLSELYNAMLENREADLPALPPLHEITPAAIDEKKLVLWKEKLSDLTPLVLKTDFMPQAEFRGEGKRFYFHIDQELVTNLTTLANEQKASIHRVFLASLYVLLYRYTGQTDICIGTASENRRNYSVSDAQMKQMVSCFVNSIPLRAVLHDTMTFSDVLHTLSQVCVSAYKNQLPFEIIAQQAMGKNEKRKTTTASPFDIIFDLNQKRTKLSLKDTATDYPSELSLGCSKFVYFGLNLDEQPNGSYRAYIEYNSDVFKENTIARMAAHFKNICTAVAKTPEQAIAELPLLTAEEAVILAKANNTELPLVKQTIVDLFEQAAGEHGDKTAVVFHKSLSESESITYSELHQKATTIAVSLRNLGIRPSEHPDNLVGVALARSTQLVTAIWSVFKAGGALLPLETKASELLRHKVLEAAPKIIIVDNSTEDMEIFKTYREKNTNNEIHFINIDHWQAIQEQAHSVEHNLHHEPVLPQHLAYIIYTSGSTDKPKGVMISHRGLANLTLAIKNRDIKPDCKILSTAPATFDAIFFDLAMMTIPCTLHLIFEEGRLSPSILKPIISEQKIGLVTLLPQICNYLDFSVLPSIRKIIIMGSVANKDLVERLLSLVDEIRIEYGPTEATVCVTDNTFDNRCCLVALSSNPTLELLENLPVPSTYIRFTNKLFYLNRRMSKIEEITLQRTQLTRFDEQLLPTEQIKVLAKNDLEKIKTITGHSHFDLPHTDIGNPIRNMKLYVLDEHGNECPFGIPGELYISGVGLAQGYLKNPTLTQQKFLTGLYDHQKHRFIPLTNSGPLESLVEQKEEEDDSKNLSKLTLYRTGDLVRRLEDGSIDFIGRIQGNKQVKIYGVRVELSSVENILKQHPNIMDCEVTFDTKNQTLRGFFVPKNVNQHLSLIELNRFLSQCPLPNVARLSSVFSYEKFPITSNGKVDLAALEKLAEEAITAECKDDELDFFNAPQSQVDLQNRLIKIWANVLKANIDSIDETFEELGGKSIDLVTLEVQLNEKLEFSKKIQVSNDLSFQMTIKSLSQRLEPFLAKNTKLTRSHSSFFNSNFFDPSADCSPASSPTQSFSPNKSFTNQTW